MQYSVTPVVSDDNIKTYLEPRYRPLCHVHRSYCLPSAQPTHGLTLKALWTEESRTSTRMPYPIIPFKHLRYTKIAQLDNLSVGRQEDIIGFYLSSAYKRIDVHHDGPLRCDVDTPALSRAVESIPLIVLERMAEMLWTYRLLHVPPSESRRVGTRARGIMRRHRVQRWLRRGGSTIIS